MYELKFDNKAIVFLEKLDKKTRDIISAKIWSAKPNPFHFFERLAEKPYFKLKVGDYRVIAEIDSSSKEITILIIGHRKNIYDRI